ncbi:MAG: hypothetical protein HRU22_01430 [Gammaproteobacteria bacterium]|nr:hypothetical protein [Gammaproteobacteria bacterium]
MHCWYWVSDFSDDIGVDFILGHALYMKAIHGGKAKMIESPLQNSQVNAWR